ncbi:MAG: ATP-binding protein [Gemmatimonadaceae bacterium]
MRRSSIAASNEQLRTFVSNLVDTQNRSLAARYNALTLLSQNDSVIRAVSTKAVGADSVIARVYLERHRNIADTVSFVSQLLVGVDASERIVLGKPPTALEMAELARVVALSSTKDTAGSSEIFASKNEVHFWSVAPAKSEGKTVGFLAEQRRIRLTPLVEQQLRDFTGQDISMFFASPGSANWISLSGKQVAAKFDIRSASDSFRLQTIDGTAILGLKRSITRTPWVLVAEISEAAVFQRSYVFLKSLLLVGVLLLGVVSVLGARWVSRHVTSPLESLTIAAQDIASGDFTRRERVQTHDELGQLAQAFNTMAERIGESHTELDSRIRESQAMTQQLHDRNEELQMAQQIALEARVASDRARAEAQQASKSKSEFLAIMSHELRTPLSAIAGYAELLQLGLRGDLNDAQKQDLSRIQANQVHLLRIINDILDLAQVESGQLQVDARPIALRDVFTDLEPIILPIVESRNISYAVHAEVEPLMVLAERERLTQVLVNLVANAARFTEAGGSVSIHGQVQDGRVKLHVTDTGIGIAPEKQETVFLPFVQVDASSSRKTQGTGLGLTISRRIVEAMKGTLSLQSELGVGSTFTLDIPAAPDAVNSAPLHAEALSSEVAAAERRPSAAIA